MGIHRGIHNIELAQLLAKTYMKYDLSVEDFMVLNAYCMHSGYYQDRPDFKEMAEMTGKKVDELIAILKSLYEREKIQFTGDSIDRGHLYGALDAILESEKSIADRLAESKSYAGMMGSGYAEDHMGKVELVAAEGGGVAVISRPNWGRRSLWDKEDMLNLADEIKEFAEAVSQKYIDEYNENIRKQDQFEEERWEEKEKERQEAKRKRKIPKPGYIILIRISNGLYKFTYTTSLLLEQKISHIKFENGDNVQIVHTLETYDTIKFFHKFIKSQFSSRLEGNYYRLTDEDVQYIIDEKYPANAMEWLEGPVQTKA